jgi:hypothetical protein
LFFFVFGSYFLNFNDRLSSDNQVWGTFGDYIGGILNPIIAAFAFYLIAKTYELQKRELVETRNLLEISTKAQKQQIQLAALTSLLNSGLMKIDLLRNEKLELWNGIPAQFQEQMPSALIELKIKYNNDEELAFTEALYETTIYRGSYYVLKRTIDIELEVKILSEINFGLQKRIEDFCNE